MHKVRPLHPLHSAAMMHDVVRNTGCYFDESRCTGRSTVLALHYIQMAMQSPHNWITIRDHHDTRMSHERLARQVHDYIQLLGLRHFTVASDAYVCFGITPSIKPMRDPFRAACMANAAAKEYDEFTVGRPGV